MFHLTTTLTHENKFHHDAQDMVFEVADSGKSDLVVQNHMGFLEELSGLQELRQPHQCRADGLQYTSARGP